MVPDRMVYKSISTLLPQQDRKQTKKHIQQQQNSSVTYMYSAFQVLVNICKPKITY